MKQEGRKGKDARKKGRGRKRIKGGDNGKDKNKDSIKDNITNGKSGKKMKQDGLLKL